MFITRKRDDGMKEIKQTVDGKTYVRIHKNKAETLFNNGAWIYVVPYKCRLDNKWFYPYIMRKKEGGRTFDEMKNEYAFYNCDNELGRYPAFYVEENELNKSMEATL